MGTLIRSRECFYKEDIENIEIFRIAEEKRGTKKEIKSLFDKNNKPTDDKNSIIQIILDFYSELYTSDGFNDQEVDEYLWKIELNKLNEEDCSVLNQFISKEECLNNIKDFENNKSPGAGEDKNIFDNIFSISDIFDYMNLNDIKGFLINFDQEKAFDKIKHEFLIKVLKKINLPVEFNRWIKILYKDIKSKIQVNGQLTEEILITRSVRQGCLPALHDFYALAIETLASSIRTNKNIKGINIPNLKDPIKLFQHADDCTTITTDIKDYYLFMNEFEKFGKASGAKINKIITEILNICNAPEEETCLKLLTKESVKTLGIWFGEESKSKS
ncbi:unnamed protein product [Mytilus coruscus]|uniref:Reverse transcriptase domain-containing protein n=1 Tax=Mytilus coruscus TaxID=42192 RepID=A0A6J8BBV1_MYTCO|nr:unnamed protein product [Mytilus coruscus]